MNLEEEFENEIEKHEKLKKEEEKRHNNKINDIIRRSKVDIVRDMKKDILQVHEDISNNKNNFRDDFYTILNKYLKGDYEREVVNKSLTIRDGSIYKYRSSREISFKYFYRYFDDFKEEYSNNLVLDIREELGVLCDIARKQGVGSSLKRFLYKGENKYIVIKPYSTKVSIEVSPIDNDYESEEEIFNKSKKLKLNFSSDFVDTNKYLRRYINAEEDIIKGLEEYKDICFDIKETQEKKMQNIREECNEEMAYVTLTKI